MTLTLIHEETLPGGFVEREYEDGDGNPVVTTTHPLESHPDVKLYHFRLYRRVSGYYSPGSTTAHHLRDDVWEEAVIGINHRDAEARMQEIHPMCGVEYLWRWSPYPRQAERHT